MTITKERSKQKTQAQSKEKHTTPVSREQTSEKAYEKWQQRGCVHGFDREDWMQAEKELLQDSLDGAN
jgi:hypothetical protein